MSGYPLHGTVPGLFPVPGGSVIDRADPAAAGIQEVEVHFGGGGKVGVRV